MTGAPGSTGRWFRGVGFPPLGNDYVVGLARAEVLAPASAARLAGAARPGQPLSGADTAPVVDLLVAAVDTANAQYFRFELTELATPADVERVGGEPWAVPGLDADHTTRKLTLVVPLGPDPAGAVTLRFPATGRVASIPVGTAAVFPAYLHAMAEAEPPCLVLVTHALGPAFR
jgi:hypothetical protein